jgi:DNA-binding transcriptional regulator GbsR (MarR family)
MSNSVRTLTELNMVEKVWKKGVRKDLYEAEKDWYQIFIDFFSNQWRKVTALNVKAIKQSMKELNRLLDAEELSETDRSAVLKDLEKYQYILDYYNWLYRLFDFLESEELFHIVQKRLKEDRRDFGAGQQPNR